MVGDIYYLCLDLSIPLYSPMMGGPRKVARTGAREVCAYPFLYLCMYICVHA